MNINAGRYILSLVPVSSTIDKLQDFVALNFLASPLSTFATLREWILASGFWEDENVWDDTAVWKDEA
jgi:hypothetical protein